MIQSLTQNKPKFCQKSATSQSYHHTENEPESSTKYLISHFELLKSQAEIQNTESKVKPSPSQSQCLREKRKILRKNPTTQNKTQRISRATPTQITNYFSTTSKAKAEASAKKLPPNEEEPPPPRKPIKSPGFQIIQNYFQTTGEAGNEGYKIQHSQKSHQLLSFVIVVNIILVVFNQ